MRMEQHPSVFLLQQHPPRVAGCNIQARSAVNPGEAGESIAAPAQIDLTIYD